MTQLYKVRSLKRLHFSDPLHWANFYNTKQRVHVDVMNRRQDLILYLAELHRTAVTSGMPLGMIQIPMRLTSLKNWVQDFRVVLDHFFEIKNLGYNFGDGNYELTTLQPRQLEKFEIAKRVEYDPGPAPNSETVISKVSIVRENSELILRKLVETGRLDLCSPVEWLLKRPEANFHFRRAGKLQQRDTSVWPVAGIECWPGWLRELLFGPGIDIDSAYTQFLVSHLKQLYSPQLLRTLYGDLIDSIESKTKWRQNLCTTVLKLEPTPENIGVVKRLCMSLANGSRISPSILTGNRAFSVTADIVISCVEDVSPSHLIQIGEALQRIQRQYTLARKVLCSGVLKRKASRQNQKLIFSSYFEWERVARYMMWEACDRHGIMVHDGIDGIPQEYIDGLPLLIEELNLRLTA